MPFSKKTLRNHCFHSLTEKERKNPYQVIDELFDFADLPDARELLWDWLKTTVTGNYHKQLTATERSLIITLYEKIEKLLEAAYLLQENHSNNKRTKPQGHKKT